MKQSEWCLNDCKKIYSNVEWLTFLLGKLFIFPDIFAAFAEYSLVHKVLEKTGAFRTLDKNTTMRPQDFWIWHREIDFQHFFYLSLGNDWHYLVYCVGWREYSSS